MITPIYNSKKFLMRIAILVTLLAAGILLAASEYTAVAVVGVVLIGAMFAHAVELQHQCLHFSGFKSRRANKIVGILLGLPTLTSFHAYRRSHLEHHRNLGTPSDTSFFTYRFVTKPSMRSLMYDLFGISHIKASIAAILGNGDSRLITLPVGEETSNNSEQFDYGLMGFLIVCSCLLAMFASPVIVLKFWILPFLLVAQPIHFLVELPEHIGCDIETTDVLHNTRTIVGSKFSSWFTNYNNMHVEHHLEPTLSMDQMPEVFSQISGTHKYITQTYWQFYHSLYSSIQSRSLTPITESYARGQV